ncbi:hypothetical protein ACFP3I_04945 [Chryseobacterium arachidis]|uniref:hypothetical protein n=1 Tax=Chryseobacterium arachidis TaxID=1416778 RepID=UPI00361625E2
MNNLGSFIRLPLSIFFADDFRLNRTRVQAKKDFRSSRAARDSLSRKSENYCFVEANC